MPSESIARTKNGMIDCPWVYRLSSGAVISGGWFGGGVTVTVNEADACDMPSVAEMPTL